ncbi:uncharacterized protein LOC117176487 [Belonocnema kinseyi]|uniref:uncharacterized protein LOC117176487 n=1 Tax=Belonocnema kinseyi TaxID=2817044 RepID=UPI00143D4BF5|nr:uncharacterized protein LOC117176487 [Belonocnema kinseyi]
MLAYAEFALNNAVHNTTGVTPSKLLFGVNQRGKMIDPVPEYLEQTTHSKDFHDIEKIRSEASEKTVKAQNYNKTYFDGKRKDPHQYEIGDFVVVKNFDSTVGVSKKLIPQYKGPYQVSKKLRNDRYI